MEIDTGKPILSSDGPPKWRRWEVVLVVGALIYYGLHFSGVV